MNVRSTLFCLVLLAGAAPAAAQHGSAPAVTTTKPAEGSQFDFLVGQWEIVAQPYVPGLAAMIHGSPKFLGTWKAWKGMDGWGIEDEIRLTDPSGNPHALTRFLRVYDVKERRWLIASLDVYRASVQTAAAQWRDGEMQITGKGTDAEGRAYVTRSRFHSIKPDSFRVQQDRSYDDGATWTEGFLKIEAKRLRSGS